MKIGKIYNCHNARMWLACLGTILLIFFMLCSSLFQNNQVYYQFRCCFYYLVQYAKLFLFKPVSRSEVMICFGDSITGGQGVTPEQSYPYILSNQFRGKVIPISQNGATTLDALKLVHKVLKRNPSLVILQFGGNDISHGFSRRIIKKNIHRLISLIQKNNSETEIIVAITFLDNMAIKNFIDEKNIKTVSLSSIFSDADSYIDPVTRHPNKKGQLEIAKILADTITKD